MIRTLRECPEVGVGPFSVVDVPLPRPVLAHRFDSPEGSMLFLHNLADSPISIWETSPVAVAGRVTCSPTPATPRSAGASATFR
jgi:hypothetical protein